MNAAAFPQAARIPTRSRREAAIRRLHACLVGRHFLPKSCGFPSWS